MELLNSIRETGFMPDVNEISVINIPFTTDKECEVNKLPNILSNVKLAKRLYQKDHIHRHYQSEHFQYHPEQPAVQPLHIQVHLYQVRHAPIS